MPVFAPFTLDFTFKKAFANEQYKVLLLFLLNTVLKEVIKAEIVDVNIIHTVQLAHSKKGRGAVFDLHCEDALGTRFIVEMHPPAYTLSFLTYDLDFGKGCDEVMQYLSVRNDRHLEIRYDIMQMVYVRLTRFNKAEEECITDLDRLLFSLKNADKLAEKPRSFGKGVWDSLYEVARISTFNKEEFMQYEREMMAFSDHAHALEFAEKKGFGKGEKLGFSKGQEMVLDLVKQGLSAKEIERILSKKSR